MNSRKMTLKFIFVTPRQLIEKVGKEITLEAWKQKRRAFQKRSGMVEGP